MKIHKMSDLHIEFSKNRFKGYTPPTDADVIVLAGDIGTGVAGLLWAAETFGSASGMPVIYVAGNHEFYGHRLLHHHYEKMAKKAEDLGIIFLQNQSVVIDGVRFLGGTMWTDFKLWGDQPLAMINAMQTMNDYKKISQGDNKNERLQPATVLGEHNITMEFLTEELNKEHDGKTVVVTHHAPSEMSCWPEHKGKRGNTFYASSNERFVELFAPTLWVHGHVHNSRDYMIGETRIAVNPRGYAPDALNPHFDPQLLLEV